MKVPQEATCGRRAGGRVGGQEPYESEQWPLAMPPPGECTMHLRMPAMDAAPREGATKMAVGEGELADVGEGAARGST